MTQTSKIDKLCAAAEKGDISTVRQLIGDGADLNARSSNGDNALCKAAQFGHVEVMSALLEAGALVDGRNNLGSTALMVASYYGSYAGAELLLAAGADAALKNDQGGTPLSFAQYQKQHNIISLLAGNKAQPAATPRAAPRLAADEVSYTYPLDDRILQEIFNFDRRERISLVRRGAGGPVEAMTRESFDDLRDKSALRRAFEDYSKKGGKLTETDVFNQTLQKPRLKKPSLS